MPIKAGLEGDFHFIYPSDEWQNERIDTNDISEWEIYTDRFYVNVQVFSD